jgi:hypothetical protein
MRDGSSLGLLRLPDIAKRANRKWSVRPWDSWMQDPQIDRLSPNQTGFSLPCCHHGQCAVARLGQTHLWSLLPEGLIAAALNL